MKTQVDIILTVFSKYQFVWVSFCLLAWRCCIKSHTIHRCLRCPNVARCAEALGKHFLDRMYQWPRFTVAPIGVGAARSPYAAREEIGCAAHKAGSIYLGDEF